MRRLALSAAAALALVPAALGLLGNDSLAQDVPTSTPVSAELLTVGVPGTTAPVPTATRPTPAQSVDDHGGDRDRAVVRTAEPGDDHGGDRDRAVTRTAEPGDDHGGGGHGSDDGPGSD